MGSYSGAAKWYDLLYSAEKDYEAEAAVLATLLREVRPGTQRVLDVACGTGEHARHLRALGLSVDGVDLEPEFVAITRTKVPDGKFTVADMATVALPERYDAILCLFSSIGYVRTVERLEQTISNFSSHLVPGGTLVVDPWFEPGQLTDHDVQVISVQADGLVACRVSRTVIVQTTSILEMEYLVGQSTGIERRSERHELGLFTQEQIEASFRAANLAVERRRGVLRKRGLYIGVLPPAA